MRDAINITDEVATPGGVTAIPVANWSAVLVYNDSDTTLYYQCTHEDTALTVANGMPLKPGEYMGFSGKNTRDRAPIKFTHAATGLNKSLRFSYE